MKNKYNLSKDEYIKCIASYESATGRHWLPVSGIEAQDIWVLAFEQIKIDTISGESDERGGVGCS